MNRTVAGVALFATTFGPLSSAEADETFPNTVGVPTTTPPATLPGQAERGFALELHLGSQFFQIAGTLASFAAIEGGIFAGYKMGRVIAGLGFDLRRVATGGSMTGQPDTSEAHTLVLFLPGMRVAVLRSSDGRVELFGQLDFGFGHTFNEYSPSRPDDSNFHFLYQLGPGIRYWVHPQFAIGALAGLRGDFNWSTRQTATPSVSAGSSYGVTSVFASLQALGVF